MLCRRYIIDKHTDLVTLVDCFSRLNVNPPPAPPTLSAPQELLIEHAVVAQISLASASAPEENVSLRARFRAPGGRVLATSETADVQIAPGHIVHQVFRAGTLPLVGSGRYTYAFETRGENGWRTLRRISVDVAVMDSQAQSP